MSSKITVVSVEEVFRKSDGSGAISVVHTEDGKKLRTWDGGDFKPGASYEVDITAKPSKNPKFGKEYWANIVGASGAAAPVKGDSKNRAFALSYAKDEVVALMASMPDYAKSVDPIEATLNIAEAFRKWLDNEQDDDNLPL